MRRTIQSMYLRCARSSAFASIIRLYTLQATRLMAAMSTIAQDDLAMPVTRDRIPAANREADAKVSATCETSSFVIPLRSIPLLRKPSVGAASGVSAE